MGLCGSCEPPPLLEAVQTAGFETLLQAYTVAYQAKHGTIHPDDHWSKTTRVQSNRYVQSLLHFPSGRPGYSVEPWPPLTRLIYRDARGRPCAVALLLAPTLRDLAVSPRCRGTGVARHLLEMARERGALLLGSPYSESGAKLTVAFSRETMAKLDPSLRERLLREV